MIRSITDALAHKRSDLADKEKGFTLIELLVVVIIIGILAAIAIPVYLGVQSNAKDSAVKSDLTNLKTAVVAYQTDNNGSMPPNIAALTSVTIAPANYAAPGTAPVLTVTGTGASATFCIVATGSNSNPFHISGSTAPLAGAAC